MTEEERIKWVVKTLNRLASCPPCTREWITCSLECERCWREWFDGKLEQEDFPEDEEEDSPSSPPMCGGLDCWVERWKRSLRNDEQS